MKILKENNSITIAQIPVSMESEEHVTNTYIIYNNNRNAILIDPGYDAKKIIAECTSLGLVLKKIYLTHCHGDHTGAMEEVYEWTEKKAQILIYEKDKMGLFDVDKSCNHIVGNERFNRITEKDIDVVKDGDIISMENINLEVIHTPGHTDGSSILYESATNSLFTGDTIFSDCYGRTDLKSGSIYDMKNSLEKVFNRFNDIEIYPGHGDTCNLTSAKRKINLILAIMGE